MKDFLDVVGTDYGIVKISEKTLAGLEVIDPQWRSLIGKKGRSKKQKYVVAELARLERAAYIAAEEAYRTGQPLGEV